MQGIVTLTTGLQTVKSQTREARFAIRAAARTPTVHFLPSSNDTHGSQANADNLAFVLIESDKSHAAVEAAGHLCTIHRA